MTTVSFLLLSGLFFIIVFGFVLLTLLFTGKPDWVEYFSVTGAGIFIGLAAFHVVPESYNSLGWTLTVLTIITGFLLIFSLERYTMVHVCAELDCSVHYFGKAAFAGICAHSVLDGVALGAALSLKTIQTPMFFAILIHKIPVVISLVLIFLKSGLERKKIIRWGFIFSITTPAGIFLPLWHPVFSNHKLLSILLCFTSGTFLYMAGAHLLSESHQHIHHRLRSISALIAGIVFMYIL